MVGQTRSVAVQLVVFDLDGTIIDSAPGIAATANAALAEFSYPPLTPVEIAGFIGPPLRESFAHLTVDPAHVDDLVLAYRRHYAGGHLYNATVYDGVEHLLSELHAEGICIAVATAKQEHFAVRILEEFGLAASFAAICGTDHDGERTTKAQVVAEVLQRLGIDDPDLVRMVGDRHHDAHGAAAHGVSTIGVLWGYGDRDELLGAGVLHLVEHPSEITALVSG